MRVKIVTFRRIPTVWYVMYSKMVLQKQQLRYKAATIFKNILKQDSDLSDEGLRDRNVGADD